MHASELIAVLLSQAPPSDPLLLKEAAIRYLHRQVAFREPRFENLFRSTELPTLDALADVAQDEAHAMVLSAWYTVKEETLSYVDYDDAVRGFKHLYNRELIPYDPQEDGVTHINVYSKGKTRLGQLLSNFAHTPFHHPTYGYFASVEAFWYWYSAWSRFEVKFDALRAIHGFQAKKVGLILREEQLQLKTPLPDAIDFEQQVKTALLAKLEENSELRAMLSSNTLPLIHYYTWGEGQNVKITYPQTNLYIVDYLEKLSRFYKGQAHKLLIFGSRSITELETVKQAYQEANLEAIEIVSGGAPGVDRLVETLALSLQLPCRVFPADWETHKKAAGMIRNGKMVAYCTQGIGIWDGRSKGTLNTIQRLEKKLGHPPYVKVCNDDTQVSG